MNFGRSPPKQHRYCRYQTGSLVFVYTSDYQKHQQFCVIILNILEEKYNKNMLLAKSQNLFIKNVYMCYLTTNKKRVILVCNLWQ